MLAANYARADAMAELISLGASTDPDDSGFTPLMAVCGAASSMAHPGDEANLVACAEVLIRDVIHLIVTRNLSGFCYLCQQLVYLVLSRIFLFASKIGESLGS
jgi:hypothetical protein